MKIDEARSLKLPRSKLATVPRIVMLAPGPHERVGALTSGKGVADVVGKACVRGD